MVNKYDYGIYRGVNHNFNYKDKENNVQNNIQYMITRTLQMFKYDGLPDTIPQRELERLLQITGQACIVKYKDELLALSGTPTGELDVYYKPKTMLINNPNIKLSKEFKVNDDMVIVNGDDLSIGLMPLLNRYCTILNENEITMIMANINKRNNSIVTATDDNTKLSADEYFKKLENGEYGVIMDSKLYDSFKSISLGESRNTLSDLIHFHQYTKATLYNELGLKENINMKKERMIEKEITSNTDIIFPLVDSMLYNRKQGIENVNKLFGTNITVELNSSWKYRREGLNDTVDDTIDDTVDDTVDDTIDSSND